MSMWERGFVHYYYGTGKGKSTAAMGLAIRTLGHGGRVYIGQFIKTMRYGDVLFLEQHTKREECVVELYGSMYGGTGCLIDHAASAQDVQAAEQGLARAVKHCCSKSVKSTTFALQLYITNENEIVWNESSAVSAPPVIYI